MEALQPSDTERQSLRQATLGDVLYGGDAGTIESEEIWVGLVRAIAAGEQLALHALYERAHRPVFTLIMRITSNRETAEELTLDVFHDVWRRASGYHPANGTVLGWVMNQARSRAIDRLRFEQRKKRSADADDRLLVLDTPDYRDVVEAKEESRRLRLAMGTLSEGEREAIDAAFFAGMTHAEAAARLHVPLGTVKTRIRSGLSKLREALRRS